MRNLIKKILKETFENEKEIMSNKINICDIMSANDWDEVQYYLDQMDYDSKFKKEIYEIKKQYENEINTQSHDGDSTNFYLRKIQNLVCK